MEDFQIVFSCINSHFKYYWESYRNKGAHPQKVSPTLICDVFMWVGHRFTHNTQPSVCVE
jgi:hypothetical protein